MYLFGGFDGVNRLNDFYKINIFTGKVKRISQHGTIPCPRYVVHLKSILVSYIRDILKQIVTLWRIQWIGQT